jgi:hypothetical protein
VAGKGIEEELKRLRDEFGALEHATSVHGGPPLDLASLARAQAKKAELLRQIDELEQKLEASKKGRS